MTASLRKKTMTLSQLQMRTLDVLRHVKFQFQRQGYEEGMSDGEFVERFVDPLIEDIYQDRQVLKMHRSRERQRTAEEKLKRFDDNRMELAKGESGE